MKANTIIIPGTKKNFKIGLKAAIPIFMGYFPISVTFGLIAKSAGLPGYLAVFMSMLNFTGATQFISVNMLVAGMSVWNILFTTLMINARYFLMSFCLVNKLPAGIHARTKNLLAFGVTDEVFVLAMTRDNLDKNFVFGSQLTSWLGWVSGTFIGVMLADFLPRSILNSTGIAIYIMFMGLILPAVRKSKRIAIVAGIAVIVSSIIFYVPALKEFVGNWRIIFTIIITSAIGAVLFPVKEEVDGI